MSGKSERGVERHIADWEINAIKLDKNVFSKEYRFDMMLHLVGCEYCSNKFSEKMNLVEKNYSKKHYATMLVFIMFDKRKEVYVVAFNFEIYNFLNFYQNAFFYIAMFIYFVVMLFDSKEEIIEFIKAIDNDNIVNTQTTDFFSEIFDTNISNIYLNRIPTTENREEIIYV